MADDLVGRTVAEGRYEIVSLLGRGGMGTVYQARQVAMDRMVALKIIRADMVLSPEAAGRFSREMRLTAKIEHPNTIRVYDYGQIEGQLYLTMEFVRGRTLTDVLAEAGGRLPLERIVRIAVQVTRALQAAHAAGVVHRDLKPDNVMVIEQYGESDVVKVLDFGVAKSLAEDQPRMTATGAVVGTPVYISPEQALGHQVDQRSDLYSLGIMLFELASGQVPFTASTMTALLIAHATAPAPPLAQMAPDVHPGLAALVDELLRKEPAGRPQSAKEVELRLGALVGGFPGTASASQPVVMPVPEAPRRGSRKALIAGIFVALLVVGGATAIIVGQSGGTPEPPVKPEDPKDPESPKAPLATPDAAKVVPLAIVPDAAKASDPDSAVRSPLEDLKPKLTAHGDPPPPESCPPAAAAAAAELVLASRDEVAGDAARALGSADQALERCPDFAAAHNVRGNALHKAGRLEDAAAAYGRAIALVPDYESPRFNLGVIQLRRKDPAAVATFDEILRRNPGQPDALKSRAQAYLNTKHYAESLADFEASLEKAPDDGKVWLIVAQLRERLSHPGARDAYCKASELGISQAKQRCGQ